MMWRKSNLEKRWVHHLKEYKHIIIYGAGMVGELVCERLWANGLSDRILCFAVSKKQKNGAADKLHGFPIREIFELKAYKKAAVVIVATLPNIHEEMGKSLSELHFENIRFVTLPLYQKLSEAYMHDFNKKNPMTLKESSRSRILLVASDNNRISGAFLCMVELCEQLQKNGVAVAVILPQYGTGAPLLSQKHIPYTYIPSKDWGFETEKENDLLERVKFFLDMVWNFKAVKEIGAFLKKNSIDLVHCNTTYTYVGAAAASQCGIPFVWHLREHMEEQGYRIFMPKRAWNLIRKSDRIIAVSEYIKNLIPFEEKEFANVVYDSVEMEEQACMEREILQNKTVQMIMVGVIIKRKKQRELIDACAVLKSRNILDFHLTIVGKETKDYMEELQQAVIEYGLEDHITFYGVSSQVSELYAQSDIAFMCSIAEPYGRVTVEAQMSGCLVIGSDSGGTPELIQNGQTGYLYEAGNSRDLAEKIITVIENPELSRKIARAGQKFALKTYTKEKNLHEIMKIYEEVLGRKL